ncbi:MAG: homoserine kinase [Halobacteriovoraceae bacterium]|mgnify:CR=1 FL=1|jgi:homoserine kinase|nr:homoserine kinase [Halobacteriovoraceae bacterium]MBT5093199.1 homoserine kinase [Halobacteriovoraceae bacterium]
MSGLESASAFAPATCGNVCVGYDILGLCYSGVGDLVTVTKTKRPTVTISKITGVVTNLPKDASKNTAGIVLQELIATQKLDFGFELSIEKGIYAGSGMGGSAASAVGALVAANHLLSEPLSKEKLLQLSLKGEELASGHAHGDNAAPCLFGGLTLVKSNPLKVYPLPFPSQIVLLLIHPQLVVETKRAREVLRDSYSLAEISAQSQNLAGFLAGAASSNLELLSESFHDLLVEPLRSPLTEGFAECRELAQKAGVLGYCLSGSGPSQLALCRDAAQAEDLKVKIQNHYQKLKIESEAYIGPLNTDGAKLL